MTRPALRLTSADDMPAPRADDDSALVLEQALDDLARLRTAYYWLGDSGVRLHALASLMRQVDQMLPATIDNARDQELTWTDIARLLGVSPPHRSPPQTQNAMSPLTKITHIMPMCGRWRTVSAVPAADTGVR